jgi:hypothetical protein
MGMRQPVGRFRVDTEESDTNPRRWGELRDGLAVRVPVTATFTPDDPRWPTIRFVVDEHSGSLVVTSVTLTATVEHPIRSDAVRVYSLPKLAAIAAKQVAVPVTGWQGFDNGEAWPPSNQAVFDSIVAATRSRTSVDRDRLDDVAKHYEAGRRRGVEEGLNVSRSQAYRLIRLAREQGLIGEDD